MAGENGLENGRETGTAVVKKGNVLKKVQILLELYRFRFGTDAQGWRHYGCDKCGTGQNR